MSDEIEALSLPPARAIAFFDGKVSIGTQRWTDVWKAGHDRAFMVAGVQAEDVLEGVRGAIAKALREGTTLAEFRRDLAPLMQRLGWQSRGKAYLGWRTRLVYETNLRGAYAAGGYEQATDPDVVAALPFWRYRHSGARDPRPEHQAWDGRVLRHDDAWWRTHHPPNGWGCGCWVEPLSPRDMERLGKAGPDEAPEVVTRPWTNPSTGQTEQVPLGIDPGWDYNVGASWRQASDLPEPPQRPPAGWVPEAPPAPAPAAAVAAGARTPRPPVRPRAQSAEASSRVPAQPEGEAIVPREFASDAEADGVLTAAWRGWAASLTAAERGALRRYKSPELGAIFNRHLRRTEPTASPDALADIEALAGALRRAVATDALRFERGADAFEMRLWAAAGVGQLYEDLGFLSSSASPAVAAFMRDAAAEPGGIVEIRVRRGHAGVAYVHPFPTPQLQQYEALFAPGTRFRVISVEAGRIVVEVE